MKLKRKHWSNIIFVAIIALIIFTPIGTFVKVKLNQAKMLFFSPSAIEEINRVNISNFDWNLVDSSGKTVNFKEMEGDIILVNFWATWCPPCVAEMPSLNELYKDYGDKITFVFLANDKIKSVNSYLKKNEYNLPVYYSKDNEPEELRSPNIPTTYLIDDQGNIVMKEVGSYNWNSTNVRNQIDEMLAFLLAE
ncbi:TlpA disulfide reductase family protein [Kordia sp.]|uniref:TlpA family protein disulfide reductase n=1 Tax=Kordia sp. TaxID=1965332 RepID=UPI0025BC3283|nr:TlpA disulfide reductase family protein [Kordia sp.]MCH2196091.1 TlpA family protein disulfide reductase [Kordia sp.]